MALALTKAAPLKADILLAQALSEYKAILDGDTKAKLQRLCSNASPTANDVMRFTAEIDRASFNQKRRRCFGPRLTNVLQSVQQFSTVVDTVVGGVDSAIASTIWGVLKLSLQIASNFSSFFDELSNLIMKIGRTSPRYHEFGLLFPHSIRLQNVLCQYHTVVVNLCKQVILFTRKSFVSQIPSFLKSFTSEFSRFIDDLDRLAVSLREEVSLASSQLQRDEADQGSNFRTLATKFFSDSAALERKKCKGEKAKSRLLDACSTYNYQTAWKQAKKKGSTNWLFEKDEYKAWRSGQSLSRALWCTGILGSGKTVLCANVVDDIVLSCPTAAVAYFFCRHDEAVSLQARTVLGSIARQLFNGLDQHLIANTSLANDPIVDTNQILDLIENVLPLNQEYFVLIDGIDECDEEECLLLTQDLQRLLSIKSSLHLYCSGRIDLFHRVAAKCQVLCAVRIAIPLTNFEIDRFIDAELEQRLESNSLCLGESSTIIAIRDALSKGAQGMYLWVSFQLETITAQSTDAAILSVLADLPKDLPETYNRHLEKLHQSKAIDPTLCKRIFQILAAAQRPLTSEELRHAASITPGTTIWDTKRLVNDIFKITNACGSFLTVDEEESTVQFAHHSIKQHLLSDVTMSSVGDYHVNLKEADIWLGEICVTYLNLDALSLQLQKLSRNTQIQPINIPSAMSPSSTRSKLVNKVAIQLLKVSRPSNYDLQHHLQKAVSYAQVPEGQQAFSFRDYARNHWFYHSRNFRMASVSSKESLSLWTHLIENRAPGDILPWTPVPLSDPSPELLNCIIHYQHGALLRQVIDRSLVFGAGHLYVKMRPTYEFIQRSFSRLCMIEPYFFGFALHIASVFGDHNTVHILLNTGVDPYERAPILGTALKAAVEGNNIKVVQLLLDIGVEVDGTDASIPLPHASFFAPFPTNFSNIRKDFSYTELKKYYGSTALTVAARKGSCEIMELLLEYGAAIDLPDENGRTALITAVESHNQDVVNLLLGKGANVDAPTGLGVESGGTALTKAFQNRQDSLWHEEIILLMINAVSDFNKHTIFDASLLHKACRLRNEAIITSMIRKGANVNAKDADGNTPLYIVVQDGNDDLTTIAIVRHLLQNVADVNLRNEKGRTALHAVAYNQRASPSLVQLLLQNDADLFSDDESGHSPHELLGSAKDKNMAEIIVPFALDQRRFSFPRSFANRGESGGRTR